MEIFYGWLLFVLELLTVAVLFALPLFFVAVSTLMHEGKKQDAEIESEAIGDGKLYAVRLFSELEQRRDYMKDVIEKAVVCSKEDLNDDKKGKNKPKKKLKKKELKTRKN